MLENYGCCTCMDLSRAMRLVLYLGAVSFDLWTDENFRFLPRLSQFNNRPWQIRLFAILPSRVRGHSGGGAGICLVFIRLFSFQVSIMSISGHLGMGEASIFIILLEM